MKEEQWYLSDAGVPIDEMGFNTIEDLLDYYKFDSSPGKVEVVLINSYDKVLEQRNVNTQTIL